MMTTMLEVAKRAGVSKATVSRVLSGNGYVSQETKDRVFQAVEESGYRPNLLARNLSAKSTQTLGLVVTNTLYHGIYFSELLFHAARMAEEKGRQLLLADGKHSAEEERQAIQYLLDLRCDAIHHDGTNHYLYRTYKPGVRQSQIDNLKEKLYFGTATRSDITRITRRLGDEIAKVYGFSIPRQRQAQAAER